MAGPALGAMLTRAPSGVGGFPGRRDPLSLLVSRPVVNRFPTGCIPCILSRVALPDSYPQAAEALQRGHGADAAGVLVRALKQPGLTRDEALQLRCALAEAWFQQDDLRQAADALGDPPEERERVASSAPVRALAAARPAGDCARRAVARHRVARPRAQTGRARPTTRAPSASPTTSSGCATATSATPRSSASTSRRRPRRCTPPATAATWRWSIR